MAEQLATFARVFFPDRSSGAWIRHERAEVGPQGALLIEWADGRSVMYAAGAWEKVETEQRWVDIA